MRFFQVRCWTSFPTFTWVVRAESPDAAIRAIVRSEKAETPCPEGTSQEDWEVYENARDHERSHLLASLWDAKVVEVALDDNGVLLREVNCG